MKSDRKIKKLVRRGYWVRIAACLGIIIGIIGTIFLLLIMDQKNFYSYGWRFLFGLSIIFIAVIGYLRINIIETIQAPNVKKFPTIDAIKNWKIILTGVLFYCSSNVLFFSYSHIKHPKIQN